MIGGSIGVSVFSAIFNNKLTGNLAHQLPQLAGNPKIATELRASPAALAKLPAPIHDGYLRAFTDSLHVVFLAAIPVGLLAFALTWLLEEVPLRSKVGAVDGVGASFGMLRSAAVLVQQEGLARVAAAKAALARIGEFGVSAADAETLTGIYTARISYLEQLANDRPEPDQVGAEGWAVAVDVLRTEREHLSRGVANPTAVDELAIRLAAARAALDCLESSPAAALPAVAPLREAYTSKIERLEGMNGGATSREEMTSSFWQATAALLAIERETLITWSMDAQIDATAADRAERDLAEEQAELATSAAAT
jgi:hypothetical protein